MLNKVWSKICEHEDEVFYTITGLSFSYTIDGNYLIPSRAKQKIAAGEFEKALKQFPVSGPGELNNIVRGPAYVYSILCDERIKSAWTARNN